MAPRGSTVTALIIPALNEAPVIGQTLDVLPPGMFGLVIVADNGSTDGTGEVARRHGAVVVRSEERGYGVACLAAIASLPPEVDVVVFLQADLSEDAAEAVELIEPIRRGEFDMMLGSRVMGRAQAGSLLPHQQFGNTVATTLIRMLYGFSYTDLGPFRAVRRASLDGLGMREPAYGWTVEMQVRALQRELRVKEVPVSYKVRAAGENKVSGNLRASLLAGYRIIVTILRLLGG